MTVLQKIFSHNYFAIIYFNFKMLPFHQAIKLPFDFYYKVRFENLSGDINLPFENLKRGMIKIGGRGSEMFTRSQTIIDLKGEIIFNGFSELGHGALIRVEKKGVLTFGNNTRIGAFSKIFCENEINFGEELDFSWECQIFDTNFHYIRNVLDGSIEEKTGKVHIGAYNWFGNRVTVMKGCKTPPNLIVASNSLCNKDYSNLPLNTVIVGIPAKQLGKNKARVFEKVEDITLFEKSKY